MTNGNTHNNCNEWVLHGIYLYTQFRTRLEASGTPTICSAFLCNLFSFLSCMRMYSWPSILVKSISNWTSLDTFLLSWSYVRGKTSKFWRFVDALFFHEVLTVRWKLADSVLIFASNGTVINNCAPAVPICLSFILPVITVHAYCTACVHYDQQFMHKLTYTQAYQWFMRALVCYVHNLFHFSVGKKLSLATAACRVSWPTVYNKWLPEPS